MVGGLSSASFEVEVEVVARGKVLATVVASGRGASRELWVPCTRWGLLPSVAASCGVPAVVGWCGRSISGGVCREGATSLHSIKLHPKVLHSISVILSMLSGRSCAGSEWGIVVEDLLAAGSSVGTRFGGRVAGRGGVGGSNLAGQH